MPDSPKPLKWQHALAFCVIAASIVTLDQISKDWIRSHIAIGDSLHEFMNVTIIHLQNSGSAFGLFTNQAFLLSVLAIVGLAIVLIFFRYFAALGFAGGVALSLIFGGALGNLLDRIRFNGYVTDFIYVRLWNNFYWPAFNVADSSITIGALLLAVIALIKYRRGDETRSKARDQGV